MKNIKSFEDFTNEELNLKKVVAGAGLAAGLAFGGGYLHDKSIEPTEIVQSQYKEVPDQFQIKQKILSIGTDMWLTNNERENFGKIEQRVLNIGKTFEYIDNTGKTRLRAKEKVLTLWNQIEIFDENNQKIGMVEQEVIESLSSIYSIYSIKDKNGRVIAKSKKLDFITTNVDFYDNNNNHVATFRKKLLTVSAKWDVNVTGDIDKRLVIFVPAFITSSQDNKKSDD